MLKIFGFIFLLVFSFLFFRQMLKFLTLQHVQKHGFAGLYYEGEEEVIGEVVHHFPDKVIFVTMDGRYLLLDKKEVRPLW